MTSSGSGTGIERPLSKGAVFFLACGAGTTIFLFYLFTVISVTLLLALLGIELVLLLAAARFGLAGFVARLMERHLASVKIFFQSFWLKKGEDARIRLQEADAPKLFAATRGLCEKAKVEFPNEIYLEMSAGAWVQARGYRRGAGKTSLGIGYDLLAGLSEPEMEAVLAHEITHAKLLQRGFTWWLGGGVARSVRLSRGFSGYVQASRDARRPDELASGLLKVADFLARRCVRNMAACSRQNEFAADLGAAELTSSKAMQSALIKTEQIGGAMDQVSWRERVSRLQSGAGFSDWIREEISKATGSQESEARAHQAHQYATHPSLHDRLAALPAAEPALELSGSPAMATLAQPDAIAEKLVNVIQEVALRAEEKDTKELVQWVRKTRSRIRLGRIQLLGIVAIIAGLILAANFWLAEKMPTAALVCLAVISLPGFLCYKLGGYREKLNLPVPDFAKIKAGWTKKDPGEETKVKEIEAGLRRRLENAVYKKERLCLLITESYNALGQCNYIRAHVAARLFLEIKSNSVEGNLAFAVAAAGLGRFNEASPALVTVQRLSRLKGISTFWGLGWALACYGEWWQAEAFLEEARKEWPEEPTLLLLLAMCRSHRGKLYTAILNARQACTPRARHTEHTKQLVELLLDAGFVKEAEQRLSSLDFHVPQDDELLYAKVRLHLLLRQISEAEHWTESLLRASSNPITKRRLAGLYEIAREREKAAELYQEVVAAGHYPEAWLGLARLNAEKKHKQEARVQALASMDLQQELGADGVHPLRLLGPVLNLLLSLREPSAGCRNWNATLNEGTGPEQLACASFGVYAAQQSEAEEYLAEVLRAMEPSRGLKPVSVRWELAPKEQQPDTPVTPGVHWARW